MAQVHLKCTDLQLHSCSFGYLCAQCKWANDRNSLGNQMLLHNLCFSWNKSSFHFLPSYCRYILAVCFGVFFSQTFWEKASHQMGFLKFSGVLSITENPEFKTAYPSVNQIPWSAFSFLSESFLSFPYFFYQNSIIVSKEWENRALIISLSCLYSRTANGFDSARAKIIKGKLQYSPNSIQAENCSFVCVIYKPADIILYAHW